MATIIRTDYPGAVHHVFSRGNNKQPIFREKNDWEWFLDRLTFLKKELSFKLYALCLMTNHFHFLLETGPVPLAKIMGRLLTAHAERFANKYQTVGHVFQDRYGAILCGRDAYFIRLVRYIHRNPVAAGLVTDPGEWPWSGHRQLATGAPGILDEAFPLGYFSPDVGDARAGYRAFMADSGDDDLSFDNAEGPSLSLEELALTACRDHGLEQALLRSGSRGRPVTACKATLLELALDSGYSQAAVAQYLGCSASALSQLRAKKLKNLRAPES